MLFRIYVDAHGGREFIFATVDSHRRGRAQVELPLKGFTIRLNRDRAPEARPRWCVEPEKALKVEKCLV